MRNLSEAEAAYLAGLIDGEGCLAIYIFTRKYNGSSYRYAHPSLQISMMDEENVRFAADLLGLHARHIHQGTRHSPGTSEMIWRVATRQQDLILEACRQTLPYLHAKREAARNVLAWDQAGRPREWPTLGSIRSWVKPGAPA